MCVEGRGLNSLIEFNQESNEMGGFGKHQEANVQENERKDFFFFLYQLITNSSQSLENSRF